MSIVDAPLVDLLLTPSLLRWTSRIPSRLHSCRKKLPSKGPANVRSLDINTAEQDIQAKREANNRKGKQPGCAGHLRHPPKSLSGDSREERVKRRFVTGKPAESKNEAGNKSRHPISIDNQTISESATPDKATRSSGFTKSRGETGPEVTHRLTLIPCVRLHYRRRSRQNKNRHPNLPLAASLTGQTDAPGFGTIRAAHYGRADKQGRILGLRMWRCGEIHAVLRTIRDAKISMTEFDQSKRLTSWNAESFEPQTNNTTRRKQ